MAALWLLLVSSAVAQEMLQDGVVATRSIDSITGGDLHFQYFVNTTTPGKDFFLTITTFSDWSSPQVFISAGKTPTIAVHDYAASPMNVEEIEIPAAELSQQTMYYVLVHCQTYCRFSAVVSVSAEVRLVAGSPVRFALDKDQEQVFTYEVTESSDGLTLVVTPLGRSNLFDMLVTEGGLHGEQHAVSDSWLAGKSCHIPNPRRTVYWVTVLARESLTFLVAAKESNGVETLIASKPTYGVVSSGQWQHYKFYIDDRNSTAYITQSVYSGEFSIYINPGAPATEHSYSLCSGRYDNETLSIDKHQRESFGAVTGWYFISVLGQSPSAFVLTASVNEDGMVPLYPGVPHSGFVDKDEMFYFYMDLPPQASIRVSVKVQSDSGEVAVYMHLCEDWILSDLCKLTKDQIQHPTKHPEIKVAQGEFRYQEVAFLHMDSQCPGTVCRYTIGVLGETSLRSNFVILTSFDDYTEHNLRNGVSMPFTLPQNQSMYFKHRVFDERVVEVNFQLTVFSGKCSLCISPYDQEPQEPFCLKSSEHRLDLHEQTLSFIKGLDFEALNVTYYLTVSSKVSCSFSILAVQLRPNATQAIRLFPGQLQRDVLYELESNDNYRLYSFTVHYDRATQKEIDFTITPFSGSFEVLISNNASAAGNSAVDFHAIWTLNGASSQRANSLRILPTDAHYLPASTYLVLVRVKTWAATHTASYSLLFASGDGSLTLQSAVPLNDEVSMGHFRYYVLPLINRDQSVTVAVTAIAGDPDIYVSYRDSGALPTTEKSDFASVGYGSEVLTVVWQASNHSCSDQSCQLCIAVYGYTDSAYSIVASVEDDTPVYIVPGIPQAGKAQQSEYRFYYTFVNRMQWFQVRVESFVGEATIFLNLLSVKIDATHEWSLPTNSSHHFRSDSFGHSSHISLQDANITQHCDSHCRADISVYCDTVDCRYSLSIAESDELQLMEGSPLYGECRKQKPVYFRFFNEKESTNIIARVASISSGDPDLYISKGAKPTPNSATWKSVTWGNEFLEIPQSDPIIGPAMMKGEFFLMVLCDRDMGFIVSVTTNQKALVRLVDGQPHAGYLHGRMAEYFYFPSALPENIAISLTVNSGGAVAFALTHDDKEEDIYEKLPNSTLHYWTVPGNSLLEVTQQDQHFCTGCNIVIAVINLENSSLYTLMVRNEGHISSLLNGQPSEGRLDAGLHRKYVFEHFAEASLDISLSVFAGSPVMTVASTPLVSESVYNWTTKGRSSTPHIHIGITDSAFHQGLYFIYVTSEDETAYSLTAHSANSVVQLVTGWAQTYSCEFKAITPLLFEYITDGAPGQCKVVSLTNSFAPTVYASFTPLATSPSFPSLLSYERKFQNYDVFYQLKLPLWASGSGKYLFAVYGNSTAADRTASMGDFQFFCLSANHTKVVSPGEIELGVLDADNPVQEYRLHVPRKGTLHVVATPCVGSLEMTVSNGDHNADLTVKRLEDGRITAVLPCLPGLYGIYISRYLPTEATVSFQLTASVSTSAREEGTMYYAGNGGIIDWVASGEKVKLEWTAPVTSSGDPIEDPKLIKYRVYATTQNLTLATACGMDVYEKMEKAWLALPTTEEFGETTATVSLPPGVKVWLNIMAIVDPQEGRDIYHVPYTQVEIFFDTEPDDGKYKTVLKGLAGVVFLLLLVILVLTCKYLKAKKLQLQLVEMLDVETITKDFNKSLKSTRNRPSIEFTPISQDQPSKDEG